ncbi:class I SAM-dependent methyltransferase [Actinomadura rupiterrae]|uniref:class I SAM-dependent methyltransferase n=1 Tax=Actinomadura rupiterrae TaxID=559627 RepID=UPI0020A4DBB0|nr:class I SAM-dependent methyltransferase [Actinomadura rupiterrae]MCP2341766.1 SAM-dependent methyltransferase [Actinomadura rupiterrae]
MTARALMAEFDDIAGWTAEAVERLGAAYAIPAACRGSANPAALAWLAEACELSAGTRLLDVGAGMGGPAAWVAARFGARPVLLEPMPGAGRAAARLFGLPVVTADGARIPLRTASVDAAWCLGVLDVLRDKAAVLREIHRVLRPGAPLGLLVVVAQGPQLLPCPEGNHFPTRRALAELVVRAGFAAAEQIDQPDVPPLSWKRRADRVAAVVASRHRTDRAHVLAAGQAERFSRLFDAGQVAIRLLHAVRREAPAAGGMDGPDRGLA